MEGATRCLNHLVTDALRHVPDCLEYLAGAKDPKVFNFVSIPQVRE
jgi:farnesyl-diphosphate farnesyltransferase